MLQLRHGLCFSQKAEKVFLRSALAQHLNGANILLAVFKKVLRPKHNPKLAPKGKSYLGELGSKRFEAQKASVKITSHACFQVISSHACFRQLRCTWPDPMALSGLTRSLATSSWLKWPSILP